MCHGSGPHVSGLAWVLLVRPGGQFSTLFNLSEASKYLLLCLLQTHLPSMGLCCPWVKFQLISMALAAHGALNSSPSTHTSFLPTPAPHCSVLSLVLPGGAVIMLSVVFPVTKAELLQPQTSWYSGSEKSVCEVSPVYCMTISHTEAYHIHVKTKSRLRSGCPQYPSFLMTHYILQDAFIPNISFDSSHTPLR